jgi:valyl-tRNA synthetase
VKPSARVRVTIEGVSPSGRAALENGAPYLRTLAGLSAMTFEDNVALRAGVVTRLFKDVRVHIEMPHGDHAAEIAKLRRQVEAKQRELAGADAKLGNRGFLEKAAASVVDETRSRRDSLAAELARLAATLKELDG